MAVEIREQEKTLFPLAEDKLFWRLLKEARSCKGMTEIVRRSWLEAYRWGWRDRGMYGGDFGQGYEEGYIAGRNRE